MPKIINLAGRKFGRWTVKDYYERRKINKTSVIYWLCICDCGDKEYMITSNSLLRGKSKSCGCLSKEVTSKKGKKEFEESSFNRLFRGYKNNAKDRNINFNLTKEQFKLLTKENCFYCGCEPKHIIINEYNNGDYIYNGVDRIDSNQGYFIENCVACCGRCNIAKMKEPQEDFINWIKKVYNNLFSNDERKIN